MPRDPFKPLTPQEQATVLHFVREGCHEERLNVVERKAKLPKGKGLEIIRRKHVALEIARWQAMVELEQARLIARDHNRAAEREDRTQARIERVTLAKIEKTLDAVLDLDPKTHSPAVLEAVRIGLVYAGIAKSGKLERTIPVKHPEGQTPEGEVGDGMYRSVFADLAAASQPAPEAAPLLPPEPSTGPLTPPAHPPAISPVPTVQLKPEPKAAPVVSPVQSVQEIQIS